MKVDAYWDIVVKDRYGRIVRKGRKRADSFLGNFLKIIRVLLGESTKIYDTGGTERNVNADDFTSVASIMAGAGDDSFGIVLSSGTSQVNISDSSIESKILHGTSSGQLDYREVTIDSDIYIDTSKSPVVAVFGIYRAFGNESGGDVNVSKVYLVCKANYWNGSTWVTHTFAIAEDMLQQVYTVPNGGSISVTLTVEVSLG